ncbi:MAG: flippase [bacterium]
MSLTRQVAHNSIIQFVGKIIGTLLALITISMMLRYLRQEGFGVYTTAINFLAIFGVLADMGLYLVMTREISKEGADVSKIASNAFTLRLTIAVIALVLAPLVALIFPYSLTTKLAILIGTFSYLAISLNQILVGIFQKHFRMDKVTIGEIVGRLIWLAGVYLAIKMGWSILAIMAVVSISSVINFLITFFFARRYVKIRLTFDKKWWWRLIKITAPLAAAVILNLIYFRAGVIILSVLKGDGAEVGILGAAQKILENLITFAAIFSGLLFPVFSKYIKTDIEKFARIFRKGFDALAIIVIPLIVGTQFVATPLMVFFGEEEFADSAGVLKALIFAVGAIFFGNLCGNAVVAANKQKKMVPFYAIAAVLAVGISFGLIPYFSYYGAVVSTLITEFLIAISSIIIIYKATKVRPHFKVFGKALLASLIMGAFLYFTPNLNFLIAIVVAGLIYFVVLYLIKGVSKDIVVEIIRLRNPKNQ